MFCLYEEEGSFKIENDMSFQDETLFAMVKLVHLFVVTQAKNNTAIV